jgi:hypothetical protein
MYILGGFEQTPALSCWYRSAAFVLLLIGIITWNILARKLFLEEHLSAN